MSLLARTLQKIFGSTGGTGEFGQFGSDSEGSPVTTKNLATIQALASYDQGWFAATDSANEPPRIQDQNALDLLFSSQLKYLFQEGIPDWIATEEYYVNGFCKKTGILYRSKTGTDGSPNINHDPAADTSHTYWDFASESVRQMEFNATALGLPFDPTDQYADMKQKIALSHKAGQIVESMLNEAAVAYSAAQSTAHSAYPAYNPIIPLWDADHTLDAANYPILVPKLRAEKVSAWSGSAYVTDHTVSVAGSVATGSGTAWDALLAQLIEDELVHGSYTNWRCININGTDYAITNVAAASHTVTVSGSPTSGSQTAIVYARRIAGSTTTARTYKDSGRALMSHDGTLRISGLRRRFHMQGHYHNDGFLGSSTASGTLDYYSRGTSGTKLAAIVLSPITDGTNGTPITGPETEPNSSTVYRAMWAVTLL